MTTPPIKITGPLVREVRVGRMHRRAETYWRAERLGTVVTWHSREGVEDLMRDTIADSLARVNGTEIRDARKIVDAAIGALYFPPECP